MLKRIIQLLIKENLLNKKQLADRVGVQEATLDDMLELLVRRGMLRMNDCATPSPSHCASCVSASECLSSDGGIREYFVTDKGRRYASL